jgi:hypothetical protein
MEITYSGKLSQRAPQIEGVLFSPPLPAEAAPNTKLLRLQSKRVTW